MIPPLIVETALEHHVNLIGITDHNASENAAAVIKAAEGKELTVLPGMELQTQEEVHCLCLFDTMDQLDDFQALVDESLPGIPNNVEYFGEQFIVDHTGEFVKRKEQLLITSSQMSIEQAFNAVDELGGLFIPAHINRQGFGLLFNLGFVPPGLQLDALEISRHTTTEEIRSKHPELKHFPLIQSGDVHHLDDFLGNNLFNIKIPTIKEIKLALWGEKGRQFCIQA